MPWNQPNSNFLESFALNNMIDPQASGARQIAQVLLKPAATLAGVGAGYLADRQQERNMELQDYYTKNNIPYKSDMQGNIVALNGGGLLPSLFGAGGMAGAGGPAGLLGGLFGGGGGGGGPTGHYGGYVTDSSGNMVRSGDGFVTYGSGPQSSNVVSIDGTAYDLSRD